MINHDEIEAKSREFEIHVANVERDYVFGWLLFGIFTVSSLKDEIFLKGGKPVEAIERSLSVLNMLQWRHELEWQNRPHRHRINIAVG
jgi:predicted nucleotidyltransferase component of viral defense system